MSSTDLAACALLAAAAMTAIPGCRIAPLQAVPTPDQLVRAPSQTPRIPPPDPAAALVPPGYRVEIAVKDLVYPSSIEFDGQGALFVAESGYVYGDPFAPARVLRILPDGTIDTVADGLSGPVTDLLYLNGGLYISHRGTVSLLESSGERRDLISGLPSLGDHFNGQLALGPDGKIYIGQGTATNAGIVGTDNFVFGWLQLYPDVRDYPARDIRVRAVNFTTLNPLVLARGTEAPLANTGAFQIFGTPARAGMTVPGRVKSNGTVLRFNPDGSGLEVYAWGLRNPFGLAWGPDHRLYATDQGFDNRGSRRIANAPDVLWCIRQDAWYGFPDYAGGVPVTNRKFRPAGAAAPEFLMADHPPVERPLLTMPAHTAPVKFDFSRSPRFGHVGQMFLAEFGDMAPITGRVDAPVGHRVVRVDTERQTVAPFFQTSPDRVGPEHLEYAATAGPKRPVDVAFSPDGEALYVVDIGAMAALPTAAASVHPFPGTGVVWRIVRDDAPPAREAANVSVSPGRAPEPSQ